MTRTSWSATSSDRLKPRSPNDVRESSPESLELLRMRVELVLRRSPRGEERTNEDEPAQVKEKVVDLATDEDGFVSTRDEIDRGHAASSIATNASSPTGSTFGRRR